MNLSFQLKAFLYLEFAWIYLQPEALQLSGNATRQQLLSSALAVCKRTIEFSGITTFHVLSMNSDFADHDLIRHLHKNMIKTISIAHQGLLQRTLVGKTPKNLIIFLNEFDEILSLILDTAPRLPSSEVPNNVSRKLPNYCVRDEQNEPDTVTCDFDIRIDPSELSGELDLTDPVFNLTKSLLVNSVWNSNNYVIFMLSPDEKVSHRLHFVFRFFWRFFRGLRTVVCVGHICHRYDPFMKSIETIDITSGSYFFFVPEPRGELNVAFIFKSEVYRYKGELSWGSLNALHEVSRDISKELQCEVLVTAHYRMPEGGEYINFAEEAQRRNFDMLIFDGTIAPGNDPSMFDFAVASRTASYCFATPHSNFIPPSLLPFKCFSSQTWAVILIVILAIYSALYAFHHSQRTLFDRLYSPAQQSSFANTNVVFYVYSYLMVGRPAKVLLGRVVTGKILFLVVSLFVLIIVTVFQSKMTTLLSKQVRYPEIDT
ncbi:unnamed protein product [Bemisia tabaci]|uniref:Ionotropic receptor n=1 Tax=Bemisia tabaci TaxID=7038 RepID=A0A9P0A2M5_BEMTA|nr:unnamed protein product [Bemisia tabaci]